MKTNLLRIGLVTALAATAALAQSLTPLRVDVPFDFTAGSRTLAAGSYMVRTGPLPGTVLISHADGKIAGVFPGETVSSTTARATGSLLFRHYGNRYVLAEIRSVGTAPGLVFPARRNRELTARTGPPEEVAIAAMQ